MPAFPSASCLILDNRTLSFNDTFSSGNASACTSFKYSIASESAFGERQSRTRSVDIGLEPPPVTSLNASAVKTTLAFISWGAPRYAPCLITRYDVWREDKLVDTRVCCDGPQTQFIDNGLTPNTQYSYKVRPISLYTGHNNNNPTPVMVRTGTGRPEEPTMLSATITAKNVSISWSSPTNPNGAILNYTVVRNGSLVGSSGQQTNFSESLNGLRPGWRYVYMVFAHTSVGSGLPASVTLETPPKAPAAPLAVYITVTGYTSAVISWEPPVYLDNLQKYEVQLYRSDGKTPQSLCLTNPVCTEIYFLILLFLTPILYSPPTYSLTPVIRTPLGKEIL